MIALAVVVCNAELDCTPAMPFLNVQLRKGHARPRTGVGLARELLQQQDVTTRLALVRMLMTRTGPVRAETTR